VSRKSLTCTPLHFCRSLLTRGCVVTVVSVLFFVDPLSASETILTNASRFVGAADCSSSGCHGGAGRDQNQYLIWSRRDPHSQRPFATLTTARSRQIADALQIKDPLTDSRCISCHAPLQEVAPVLRADSVKPSEGVSCESCHGPAELWLRSHTRKDWTHADRTFAGMRDLKNLYVRGNTCVACHQTVAVPLLKAGHPELIFELDGQCVSQPRHWRETSGTNGAQVWLVGQAVALRELSWQLSQETQADEKLMARWNALVWLLQRTSNAGANVPALKDISSATSPEVYELVRQSSDEMAKRATTGQWNGEMSRGVLRALLSSAADFEQPAIPVQRQARRAERLVLALERLLVAEGLKPGTPTAGNLDQLFELAQSLPDFEPTKFAATLRQLSASVDN
jgi:hypothetical protein